MKVTRRHLRQIIKEELAKINESSFEALREKAKRLSMTEGKTAAIYDESGGDTEVYLNGEFIERFALGSEGFIIGEPESFEFAAELKRRKIKWVLTESLLGEGEEGGESVDDYIQFITAG